MIPLFLSLFAQATNTFEIDVAVVGTKPAGLDTVESVGVSAHWSVAPNESDAVAVSSWSYITCGVEDEHVFYRFEATDDDWPTSFPQQVTCQLGGYTLIMNLVPRLGSWDIPPKNITFLTGVSAAYPDVGGAPTGGMETFDLPNGDYSELLWTPASASVGGAWAGVKCRMAFAPNGPKLQLYVDPSAAAGTGFCILPNPSGPSYQIPVTLTR